jgi:hypothetical protein
MSKFKEYLEATKREDDDEETVADEVRTGDYVDFGIYGKLWVVRAGEDRLWVTDLEKERKNPDAPGWFIRRSYAEKIIKHAYDDED